jgi:hypothetical protein
MQASLLRQFQGRRFSIRARWEALLRAEPVATPLGLPDALVHLIEGTLEEIFATLDQPSVLPPPVARPLPCPCGRNPLLAYYAAAEQALREGLVLAQAASAPLDPTVRDASLRELNAVLQRISRREIEAFCGICQFREKVDRQPLLLAAGQ